MIGQNLGLTGLVFLFLSWLVIAHVESKDMAVWFQALILVMFFGSIAACIVGLVIQIWS